MKIDLNELNYKDRIEIDNVISFPKEGYSNDVIRSVEDTKVEGFITLNSVDEYIYNLEVNGKMIIPDSITNENITYEYNFLIEEEIPQSCINEHNMLDLTELLWQNIVLEVPMRYTNSDATNLKGDHWEVIDEIKEEEHIDPRLEKLNELFNEGGE